MEEVKKLKTFDELRLLNVNDYVEKKMNLAYLSWSYALDLLLQNDPDASWEYTNESFPDQTMMYYCTVTAFGKKRTAQLPVMNHKNQPIVNPNAFERNTAMQRALAKAIALHGIGLYIYAGEDLPPGEEREDGEKEKKSPIAEGNRRTGIKSIDAAVNDAIGHINNCDDLEGLKKVYETQYRRCQTLRCTKDQLDLLFTQYKNTEARISNKAMDDQLKDILGD